MILVNAALMKADTFAGEAGQKQSKVSTVQDYYLGSREVTCFAFHQTSPVAWSLTQIC